MPKLILVVLVDDCPLECGEFKLHELDLAREWVQEKILFYAPVVVDMLLTVEKDDEPVATELIPEFSKVYLTMGNC
jgi:hypothetical protein